MKAVPDFLSSKIQLKFLEDGFWESSCMSKVGVWTWTLQCPSRGTWGPSPETTIEFFEDDLQVSNNILQ